MDNLARFWRDPALPFVESRRACASRAAYRPHTHTTLSIGVVDSGTSTLTCHGTRVAIGPGTLVTIPAGCVHSCNPASGGHWSYQMLHLDSAWVEAVLAQASGMPAAALQQVYIGTQAPAYQAFCRLNQWLFSDASTPEKAAALVRFIHGGVWCAAQSAAPPRQPTPAAPALERVQTLLREQHAEPLPLAALAQIAGMDRYALIRAFRSATGMTPHAYQLDQRIAQARALLRAGAGLADVAHTLGFCDQSHFQKAFKQRVAATPGTYRQGG